jgi:hypothetical protein
MDRVPCFVPIELCLRSTAHHILGLPLANSPLDLQTSVVCIRETIFRVSCLIVYIMPYSWILSHNITISGYSHGIAITSEGFIISLFNKDQVKHIRFDGYILGSMGFRIPTKIEVRDSHIWIADFGNSRLVEVVLKDDGRLTWKGALDLGDPVYDVTICKTTGKLYASLPDQGKVVEIFGNTITRNITLSAVADVNIQGYITCSDDSRYVATSGINTVEVFATTNYGLQHVKSVNNMTDTFDLAFLLSGHLLVVRRDVGVYVVEPLSGRVINVITTPKEVALSAIAVWPNGSFAVTGTRDSNTNMILIYHST